MRQPDVTCLENEELVVAWFQQGNDGYAVRLKTSAYRQHGDLKVRRSSDTGVSFGSARTIRAAPSGKEVTPTSIAVRGSRVALAAVEVAGSNGKGLGYRSTNGGSSYTQVSSTSAGYKMATLVRPAGASHYRYAEAWDRAFPVGDPIESVRNRRE